MNIESWFIAPYVANINVLLEKHIPFFSIKLLTFISFKLHFFIANEYHTIVV